MLTKFEVSNFKCFDGALKFDLSATNGYTFNPDCIKNGNINCAMVYGYNGSGKSNLGWAIFDIIEHLTDRIRLEHPYRHYTNAANSSPEARFAYEFQINGKTVRYEYSKTDYRTLVDESLWIDGELLVCFDRRNGNENFKSLLKGTESLNTTLKDPQISVLKYIRNNSSLEENDINRTLLDFFSFVDRMLFFRSLEDRTYIGLDKHQGSLSSYIIKSDKVKDFEDFLREANVDCRLAVVNVMDEQDLAFDFGDKKILFRDIMSTGTSALMLFYCWYQHIIASEVSFVFIDEFDAFYHHELSRLVVKKLKESGVQFVLTTHNISIMSNDLMRPDCYFLIYKTRLLPLSKCTDRELREAHNIEKIYKSGAFNVGR
ncbi:MAG: ATP-binding protein [Duncaniella sp.]|uniref:AAA family ATPase n=1 Tax=Duncaniella sp. TaxID=2518496 RepID=UPI0023CB2851|nr:ATP-binding protein [Duncaniella sp.]MDE5988837.1 ATP-binding protein [Duncaniella sp.]